MTSLKRKALKGYEVKHQGYMTIFIKSMAYSSYHILGYLIDSDLPILDTFITKSNLDYYLEKFRNYTDK